MVKGKAEITLSHVIDIDSVTRFYLLQSSTINIPTKPATYPPGGNWKLTEPSYTEGSTNTLYIVDCTVFSNGGFKYSDVSKSSAYEAAKAAYNKAVSVGKRVEFAETQITQNRDAIKLKASKTEVENIQVGGRNYFISSGKNVFDKNNEYTLNDYQNVGSFSQFYNLVVPMSYFSGTVVSISFDAISPNGDASITVYNNNGKPRYCLTFFDTNKANIGTSWSRVKFVALVVDMGDTAEYSVDMSNKIEFYCPTKKGCKIRNVKFEVGNKPTDWSPAPEDMATAEGLKSAETATDTLSDTMAKRIEQVESTITQVADSISMMVVDQNGSSLMEQTADGWVFSMGETLSQLQKATDDLKKLESDLDTHDGSLTALQNVVKGLEDLTSYIRISVDGNQPCIELGNDSAFKLVITNTGIKMMDGSTVPAYVTNQSLKIGKAEVEDELTFGGFAFSERNNGNMGLIWKGG